MTAVLLALVGLVVAALLAWGLHEAFEYVRWISLCKELERAAAARGRVTTDPPPE
jgi:fatty acid desaturase